MHPDEIHQEREDLIAEIFAAFDGVSREGGISWSEACVIDYYGAAEERRAAQASDKDTDWTELIDDPKWEPTYAYGGFAFLDAIGFRYYLAPALMRSVRHGEDCAIRGHLTVPPFGEPLRDNCLEKLSLLDDRQRRCVARVIRFMIALSRVNDDSYSLRNWSATLDSHWSEFA